jgi:hypothetical protein
MCEIFCIRKGALVAERTLRQLLSASTTKNRGGGHVQHVSDQLAEAMNAPRYFTLVSKANARLHLRGGSSILPVRRPKHRAPLLLRASRR